MVKIIVPQRGMFLAALFIIGLALIVIGYNGVGDKKTIETTSATITEKQPEDNAAENQAVNNQAESETKKENFFIEYRLERERTRGQQVELLREIINDPNADAETRKKSQEDLYTITHNIGKEMEVENLIRAKGFKDAVVLIKEKGATVVVQAEELNETQAARIAEIVSRNTGIMLSDIVIIPRN